MYILRVIKELLVFSCLLLWSSTGNAGSTVWQINSGVSTLYLAGTIHMLRTQDYPLPEQFDRVYKSSDSLIFETDIGQLKDPLTQSRIQRALVYSDGDSLKQHISDPLYQRLVQRWQEAGLPPMLLRFIKPGGVVMTLTMAELNKIGVDTVGIDEHFHQLAIRDRKPVKGLESIDTQISYLAGMGQGNEEAFLEQTFTELEQSREFMNELIAAWRQGDRAELEKLVVKDMQEQFPALYQSLLVERNRSWLPQIETMLQDQSIELVLVGAGHLVGEDGLLQQLKDQGYGVEQVQ